MLIFYAAEVVFQDAVGGVTAVDAVDYDIQSLF